MRERSMPGSAAVVVGFSTALGMWSLGYLARLPAATLPGAVVLAAMLLCLAGGGAWSGRTPGGGARTGAAAGITTSLVNLLVLGSLLSGRHPNELLPSATLWIPGSLLVGAACGALGGLLGRRLLPSLAAVPDWTGALAKTAAAGTLVLVAVGGIVTSQEAGLAVVDWPNSYGYNMFLYPLSRMVGGIYYEHAHRLFGSLVGLTTLALCVRILAVEPRRPVKAAAIGALLLVIVQGVLGGLRVTGHFTLATSTELTRPSLALAMVHGMTGQIFFVWMVGLAAVTSRTWKTREGAHAAGSASTDRALSGALLGALLLQLFLGIRVRHLGEGAMIHMTFAAILLALAVGSGSRAVGLHGNVPALRRSGRALLVLVTAQVLLGGLAFFAVGRRSAAGAPPLSEVLLTTAHQTVGALLVGTAALVVLWVRRLLTPEGAAPERPGEVPDDRGIQA